MGKKKAAKFNWKQALLPMHWITVVSVVLLDQLTKYWIIFNVPLGGRIEWGPYFAIVHTKNKGAAFGLFHDSPVAMRIILFGAVTVLCVYLLLQWLSQTPTKELWQRFGFALILGGAFGNLKDRIAFGKVTDFIDVYIPWFDYHWPAFNVADSAITVGVTLVLIRLLYLQLRPEKK